MELMSRDGTRKWTEVHWRARRSDKTSPRLVEAGGFIEQELLELWSRNAYRPESGESGGVVFPADRHTLERVHTEPEGRVQVGYVIADGEIVAGLVLHVDNAIGGYANGSVDWATGHFQVERRQVAFIRSLVVSPKARGFGIGRLLLKQASRRAKLLGAHVIISHLRVSPGMDERLSRAYQEAGFSHRSEVVTMTIERSSPNRWREFVQNSREAPCAVDDLLDETVELSYVCVGTRCTRVKVLSSSKGEEVLTG